MTSSNQPLFILKGEHEWPGWAVSCCRVSGSPPKGCKMWPGGQKLPSAPPLHTPLLHGFFPSITWVSAANWLELFSNRFISPELGNFESISFYPLLKPGLHLSYCFPSHVVLLSAHNEPIVSPECWLWPFLPQHLGASASQHFSPKREKHTEAGNHPRKHWRYSLVDFSYI